MTMVDDRLDIEVEEIVTPDNPAQCVVEYCDREAGWLVIWSCGHAFRYCNECTQRFEWEHPLDIVVCSNTGVTVHILRKEPLS